MDKHVHQLSSTSTRNEPSGPAPNASDPPWSACLHPIRHVLRRHLPRSQVPPGEIDVARGGVTLRMDFAGWKKMGDLFCWENGASMCDFKGFLI